MKLAAVIIIFINFAFMECVNDKSIPTHTAYGYLEKVAIPEANRIRKAEEKLNSQQRIIGGTPADYGQYPYQVGLLLSITNLTGAGACGGTVLNENRILTAAHCWFDGVNQVSKVTVILGSVFLFFGGVRTESNFVVTHPQWTPMLARNDIAVIYLPNSIAFSTYIAPIALPSGDELNEDFVGAIAIASGFGVTQDYGTVADSPVLNFVRLKVIGNEICEMVYPTVVQPTNICTSDLNGGSTCRGDSGGPLVVERDGRSVLIGVTSFGSILGCELGLPSVFARVTSFITFINDNL